MPPASAHPPGFGYASPNPPRQLPCLQQTPRQNRKCISGTAPLLSAAAQTLDIYAIDVVGGNATLFVTPARESLLIDTGNAGPAAPRDAGRILEAAHAAGLSQIDHLITTHWHGDHFGGL